MDGKTFEGLMAWQAEKESRSVEVKVEGPRYGGERIVNVWVYDFDLGTGQHVTCAEEIDLEATKDERERREYERLKAKFEPGAVESGAV